MKARRFRASQAWPSDSSPSRPAGSRSAAAVTLARWNDQSMSATSASGVRRPGAVSPASTPPGRQSQTTHPWSVRAVRSSCRSPCVRSTGRRMSSRAEPLHEVGHTRRFQQRGVGGGDRRLGLVHPVDHLLVVAQEGSVQREVQAGRHDAECTRLAPEVAARLFGCAAGRVEVAQRRQREGPAARAVGQRLLHDPEVAALPHPAHERRRHVVEPRFLEPDHEVDVGSRRVGEPREDQEVAPVPAVEDGRRRCRRGAPQRDQAEARRRGPWPTTRAPGARRAAHRCTRRARRRHRADRAPPPPLHGGSAARRRRPAGRHDQMGQAAPDVRHDVEQAGAAGARGPRPRTMTGAGCRPRPGAVPTTPQSSVRSA